MGSNITNFISNNFFKGDKAVWMIYFLLCVISIVEIYSASSMSTYESGKHWAPVISQFGFLLAGFIVILIVHRIPCKWFMLLPLILIPLSVILLICVKLIGGSINNAQRWLPLGQFSFQPSELAKTALVLGLAFVLAKSQVEVKKVTKKGTETVSRAIKGGHSKPFKTCCLLICLICGLICMDNLSTALMLFAISVLIMFIGNIPRDLMLKGLGVVFVAGVIGVTALLVTPREDLRKVFYRAPAWKDRIEAVFKKDTVKKKTLTEVQKQETSALISISNSNIVGRGAGNSEGRDFLYHAESDFIYAIIIEELGLGGGLLVLFLYVFLLVRAGKIAQRCDKFFPAFLVMGLGIMITLQALINMGVAVHMLPITGQTLPLISKGGTSIILVSFNIGMILSISRYADKINESKAEPAELVSENETNEYYSKTGME